LRRRRRQATQTIRKKNHQTSSSPYFTPGTKTPSTWRRVFLYFIVAAIVVWITYYLYQKNFQPTSIISTQQDTIVSQSSHEVPVETSAPFEENVQIEILNGCGVNGIAKVFQSYLRQNGFDVVNTDNYIEDGKIHWDLSESMIIDHVGDSEKAKEVARVLRLSPNKIIHREDPTAIYDVSVVLGKDYKKLLGAE
jgi:hypothetical protein